MESKKRPKQHGEKSKGLFLFCARFVPKYPAGDDGGRYVIVVIRGQVLDVDGRLSRGGDIDFDCTFGSGFAVTDRAVDGAVVGTGQRATLGRMSIASEWWGCRRHGGWWRDIVVMLDRSGVVVDDLLNGGDLLAVGKSLEKS